eukprot:6782294-Prymnesium_polylepis.2
MPRPVRVCSLALLWLPAASDERCMATGSGRRGQGEIPVGRRLPAAVCDGPSRIWRPAGMETR